MFTFEAHLYVMKILFTVNIIFLSVFHGACFFDKYKIPIFFGFLMIDDHDNK